MLLALRHRVERAVQQVGILPVQQRVQNLDHREKRCFREERQRFRASKPVFPCVSPACGCSAGTRPSGDTTCTLTRPRPSDSTAADRTTRQRHPCSARRPRLDQCKTRWFPSALAPPMPPSRPKPRWSCLVPPASHPPKPPQAATPAPRTVRRCCSATNKDFSLWRNGSGSAGKGGLSLSLTCLPRSWGNTGRHGRCEKRRRFGASGFGAACHPTYKTRILL